MNEPTPFATRRRVGCVMWLAIAALIVSSISILLDVTQELAWNERVEQVQAVVAAPIAPVVEPVIVARAPTARSDPSLEPIVTPRPIATQTRTPAPPYLTPLL